MANHDEVIVEASEIDLVDSLLIPSSSPILRGRIKYMKKNDEIYKRIDGRMKNFETGDPTVEEYEISDSDIDMDMCCSSNEEVGEDHDEPKENEMEIVKVQDNELRTCASSEAASSEGLPSRLPTFHASTLGRWHAVISYDACVRLCLRFLGRGCKEADIFLENECRLLRRAFSLDYVLLQPESIPINKGSTPITLKHIGRLYVQVRKVKMGLDSPIGCCFSNIWSTSSYAAKAKYICILRLRSSKDDRTFRMQPGSSERHLFFPDSGGDELLLEVQDYTGRYCGSAVSQINTFIEEPGGKVCWLPIYREPEKKFLGEVQLSVDYNTSYCKGGSVAETVAYDFVLEVAMKAQHFQQKNLVLHGEWKWLLTEFASCYGVSDSYVRLRYLSYVMEVATPAVDCLVLVHDLLYPIKIKGSARSTLSLQENRILGEIEDRIEQILSLAFENYKALDDTSLSGVMDDFRPANGSPAPALAPAVKLYNLLYDIESLEAQLKLRRYFEVAAEVRSRRHLDEMDAVTKMKSLFSNFRNEIFTDIEIYKQHVLPSCIDLPDISSSIYSMELRTRLRAFLVACSPESPSSPVRELVNATAEFQKDLISWNVSDCEGGVDGKQLFHPYFLSWIESKRMSLLDACKLGVKTQQSTFVDHMYDRLNDMFNDYEFILRHWPEYTCVLENAIVDVERALVAAQEQKYEDVLSSTCSKKLAHRSVSIYEVPAELGVFMNSIKRMLDILHPGIETRLQSWSSCIPSGCSTSPGKLLKENMVELSSKFRSYLQAIDEKLIENTKVKVKIQKILHDIQDPVVGSDVGSRLQPLKNHLSKTVVHLHSIFDTGLFLDVCRRYWDSMGQEILSFLVQNKENMAYYRGARIRNVVSILDDIFVSQIKLLLGNALQEKDLAPPRSSVQVLLVLGKDTVNHTGDILLLT